MKGNMEKAIQYIHKRLIFESFRLGSLGSGIKTCLECYI